MKKFLHKLLKYWPIGVAMILLTFFWFGGVQASQIINGSSNSTITSSTNGNFVNITWQNATGTNSYLPYVTSTQVSAPYYVVPQYTPPTSTANTIYNSGGNLYFGQNPISYFNTPLQNLYPISGVSLVGTVAGPTSTASLLLQGGWLYAGGGTLTSQFHIYDATNPMSPRLVSTIPIPGVLQQGFTVVDDYLYAIANNTTSTLHIYNISNKAVPVLVSTSTLAPNAARILVEAKTAYITQSSPVGVGVWDLSDLSAPVKKNFFPISSGGSGGIDIKNNMLYIVGTSAFEVWSLADPNNPAFVASSTLGLGTAGGNVKVQDGYAYMTRTTVNKFMVVDVSNPLSMTVAASTTIVSPQQLDVAGRYAIFSSFSSSTMYIYDVLVPSAPVLVATLTGITNPNSIVFAGNVAYIAQSTTPGSILIVNLSGTEVSSLVAHNFVLGKGWIRNSLGVGGDLDVKTGVKVGAGGILNRGALYTNWLTIGNGGAEISKHLSATSSLNFGATAAGTCERLTMTVTGAVDGDVVTKGIPVALRESDAYQSFDAYVSAANTVTVERCNLLNAVSALSNPAAAVVRVSIDRY